MQPRLIQAPISITFSQADVNPQMYEREYHQLSESEDNAINQWLKLAKARGETSDTDPVLLNLVVELHNKLDALELFLKDEVPHRVPLTVATHIDAIGFEYFNLLDAVLEQDVEYYGRIEMPVHPKRDVGVFFKAQSETLAKITRMHERDEREWGAYMTARERVLIREAREKK